LQLGEVDQAVVRARIGVVVVHRQTVRVVVARVVVAAAAALWALLLVARVPPARRLRRRARLVRRPVAAPARAARTTAQWSLPVLALRQRPAWRRATAAAVRADATRTGSRRRRRRSGWCYRYRTRANLAGRRWETGGKVCVAPRRAQGDRDDPG